MSAEDKILSCVSRETYEKFRIYLDFVKKWNRNTSLVQVNTIPDFMNRHILDSLQLSPYLDPSKSTIDIGTGAGFPGMVLAISGVKGITLCDSNQRKMIFLTELKRELDVDVTIICSRVEELKENSYHQVITRACADLSLLLKMTSVVSRETQNLPQLIVLKGRTVDDEIEAAKRKFNFNYQKFDSLTSADGIILKITDIEELRT